MLKEKKEVFIKLLNLIEKYDFILLFRHILPDGDALGSVWGLAEVIKKNYPHKKVLVLGEEHFPNENMFPQNNILENIPKKKTLAIICDTANEERIDGKFWRTADFIVKIDHHPHGEKSYAHLDIIFENTSSTCEVICSFIRFSKLHMTSLAAHYLYIGITTDTGRFLYPGVDETTFSNAGFLIQSGAIINSIYQNLYSKNIKLLKFLGLLINKIEFKSHVMGVFISQDDLVKHGINAQEAKLLINQMSGYKNFDIWVMAIEKKDHIKISIRSTKNYYINKIAKLYNGGGHKNASACKAFTLEDYNNILKLCDKVKPQKGI